MYHFTSRDKRNNTNAGVYQKVKQHPKQQNANNLKCQKEEQDKKLTIKRPNINQQKQYKNKHRQ